MCIIRFLSHWYGYMDSFMDLWCCRVFDVFMQVFHRRSYSMHLYLLWKFFDLIVTHLFWIWTIHTRGTTSIPRRSNIPDNKYGDSTGEYKLQFIWSSSVFKHLSESKLQYSIFLVGSTIWLSEVLVWNNQISSNRRHVDFICSVLLLIH